VPHADPAEVAQADGLAVLFGDHAGLQVSEVYGLRVGQDLELQFPAVHATHGLEPMLLAQQVGHLGDRQSSGHQPLRLHLDEDFADVAPLHRNVGHVFDAADPRAKVVEGIVVQG